MTLESLRRTVIAMLLIAVTVASFLLAPDHERANTTALGRIGGPYANLLNASTDLGPARGGQVQLTAALRAGTRPDRLIDWAGVHGLTVRWRTDDRWAILEGPPVKVSEAFGVDVHDFRGTRGQVFYASPQQPAVPAAFGAEVAGLGRILGYTPYREAKRWVFPTEVPDQGLTPDAVLRTYNVQPLRDGGYTGKGVTVARLATSSSSRRASRTRPLRRSEVISAQHQPSALIRATPLQTRLMRRSRRPTRARPIVYGIRTDSLRCRPTLRCRFAKPTVILITT